MNIGMLTTLVAIVDRGTLAAAAQQVGCTPSAVSLQVKQLEAYFGQPLFDRSTRAVRPTPFGEHAAATARELVQRLDNLRAKPTVSVAGRLRLGAIASVQADVLPQALRSLRDRHPALDVVVTLNDSEELLTDLKAARIDAAVLVRPSSGGSSRLAWHDLTRQPFVMLAPASAPDGKPAEMLQRLGWIRYDVTSDWRPDCSTLRTPAGAAGTQHDGAEIDRCDRRDGRGGTRRDGSAPATTAADERLPDPRGAPRPQRAYETDRTSVPRRRRRRSPHCSGAYRVVRKLLICDLARMVPAVHSCSNAVDTAVVTHRDAEEAVVGPVS